MAGNTGFSNSAEAAILDDATVGLGRTLYLALFKWTGTAGAGAGNSLNDDGTAPTNVAEVSASGYSRLTVSSGHWAAAVAGAPTYKVAPTGATTYSWTATAAFGELCAWGLYTASTGGTYVCGGVLTTSGGTATSVTVNAGETFQFDSSNQLKVQLGDPGDTFA